MEKTRSTKRALVSSLLVLALCFTMLAGTTFAWFTDSVTSTGNIIKAGNLKISMKWANGTEDPAAASWNDASAGAIFDYSLWEPGYTEVRHIAIANDGSLALKYKVQIAANGTVSALADVIDVYYYDPAVQIASRADLDESKRIGTLAEALAGMSATAEGVLVPVGKEGNGLRSSETLTIALKMRESAGNEYQGLSIGTDFSVKLAATQYSFEADSFDETYDAAADYDRSISVATPAELAAVVAELNGNERANEETVIKLAEGTYGDPVSVELYPNAADYHANGYINNMAAADANDIVLKGEGDVVFTGGLTINGGNRAQSGLSALRQGNGRIVIDGLTFKGVLQSGDVDTVIVRLAKAAHDVVFRNCTFIDQTHINVGTSGNGAAGTVIFENCSFNNAACISGVWYDLQLIGCTGNIDSGHGKGFINGARAGETLVKDCVLDVGSIAYFARTNGSDMNVVFEDCAFTGTPAKTVNLRGSNQAVAFRRCTLNGGQIPATPSDGVGTNGNTLIIE
ncbi:MAG: hypothetical protein IJL83_05105 [Clostridia bacterium]|nr:hypothetical protein [Clostridia bacterium]